VVGAELMPSLVGGDTETIWRKLKKDKGFLKPNFEALPELCQVRLYQISKNSSGDLMKSCCWKGPIPEGRNL
jgi:hypothetical protein